jgi:hypothetical protein
MWKPQAILPYTAMAAHIQHRHKIVAILFSASAYLPRMQTITPKW